MDNIKYRCGYCGHMCDENGIPTSDIYEYGMDFEHVHGLCCLEEQCHGYITREMAMDAGDLSLEGLIY